MLGESSLQQQLHFDTAVLLAAKFFTGPAGDFDAIFDIIYIMRSKR